MGQRGPAERYGKPMRLRPEIHDRLTAAAAERDVTAAWLANRLLAQALDNLVPADEMTLTRRDP